MAEVRRTAVDYYDPKKGLTLGQFRLSGKQTEDTKIINDKDLTERIALLLRKNELDGLSTEEESDLTALKLEQEDRGNRKAGSEESHLREIIGANAGVPASGSGSGSYGSDSLDSYLKNLLGEQEGLVSKRFSSLRKSGEDAVRERYAGDRKRAIEEAAATGNLSSPSARYSINAVDANRNKSLDNLLNELSGQEAGAQLGQNTNIANMRLSNAGRLSYLGLNEKKMGLDTMLEQARLIANARSGVRSDSMQRDIFNENRRSNAFGESEAITARKYAEEIGRKQADSEGDDFLSTLTGVASGIGGLAGGAGALAGGIGTFMNARKKKTATPTYAFN